MNLFISCIENEQDMSKGHVWERINWTITDLIDVKKNKIKCFVWKNEKKKKNCFVMFFFIWIVIKSDWYDIKSKNAGLILR